MTAGARERPVGVILAAGLGLRLRPHTETVPKALTPLGRECLLERTLRLLAESGIQSAWIVVGHAGDKIAAFVASRRWNLDVRLIPNEHYASANNIMSVAAAREIFGRNDVLLIESDVVFSRETLAALLGAGRPNAMLVSRHTSYMDGAVVVADEGGRIVRRFLPDRNRPGENHLKTLNVNLLSRDFSRTVFLPLVDSLQNAGSNLYYDDLIGIAIELDLARFDAVLAADDSWYEIDNVADLKAARDLFAALEDDRLSLQERHGGYWKFPSFQDSCLLVNPFFPTPGFMNELLAMGERLVRAYPSGQADQTILAERAFGVRAERLAIGNGASELITAVLDCLPGKVAMPAPSFEEYYNRLPADRLSLFEGGEPWYRTDPLGLAEHAERTGADSVILVNPENPTGALVGREDMLEFIARCGRAGLHVLVDESFIDFADAEARYTLLSDAVLADHPHLLVLKSISKSYGAPGIRLGLVAGADPGLIAAVRERLAIWNIGSLAERFLELLPRYRADYEAALDRLVFQRERMREMLARCPFLDPKPSSANFILCEVRPPWTARRLAGELLAAHRIIAKDCTGKRGIGSRQCVRFAVGDDAALERLSSGLAAIGRLGAAAA